MLHRVLECCSTPMTLVLGANAKKIYNTLPSFPGEIIVHTEWAEGLSSSLCAALKNIPSNTAAILFVLGDQPLITQKELKNLHNIWKNNTTRIVAAEYGENIGAPCIFPCSYFTELQSLKGDRGAQALLKKYYSQVLRVTINSASIDIDTPADLYKVYI